MDFVRLGARYTHNYMPTDLIEGYNSLIWTERFFEPGEFQLKSYDVQGMTDLLPEDTLVSHLDTREVMQVETHSIEMVGEGEDAIPEITIKGRSATLIFDHRWVESTYKKKRRMRKKYSATAAAGILMWQAVDNGSGKDVTRGDDDPDTEAMRNNYPWTIKDVIPNVAVTDSVAKDGETRWWKLEQGMLLPQLTKILVDADLGIRCLRPVTGLNPATVITVKTALAERGVIVRTANPDVTQLRFDIYSGIDRSGTVQFSQLQGHLDKPQYLTSTSNLKTMVEIMSDEINVGDFYLEGDKSLEGWRRRTIELDAGSPEIPDQPDKPNEPRSNATAAQRKQYREDIDKWQDRMAKWRNKRSRIVDDFREESQKEAKRLLKQRRRVDMFAGDVSNLSPYIYKTHYDLGDTVMLFGDYGKQTKMIVSEFVRTENADGDRGFPGLVAP